MIKKDSLPLGIILGIFAPVLGVVGFYFWRFSRLTFWEFIQYLGIEKHLITGVISFSLLANAILFTIFINNNIDHTAKGIFIVTIIYAALAIGLKFWYS